MFLFVSVVCVVFVYSVILFVGKMMSALADVLWKLNFVEVGLPQCCSFTSTKLLKAVVGPY